jgi:hypothetical protein
VEGRLEGLDPSDPVHREVLALYSEARRQYLRGRVDLAILFAREALDLLDENSP